MTDTAIYLLAAAADKASPSRPELLPGKLPGAAYEVRDLATGEVVTLSYDSVTVGAGSLKLGSRTVCMYGVLARALRYAGCTREAVAHLVTEATAAELRGDAGYTYGADSDAVKAQVEALAGGVTVKGARFEAAAAK